MEDKIFDLIEKMYSDLKSEIKTVGNQVAKIENDLKPKVETALEGYTVVYEKLNILESKIDNINSKVEKQEFEIRVIKGGK